MIIRRSQKSKSGLISIKEPWHTEVLHFKQTINFKRATSLARSMNTTSLDTTTGRDVTHNVTVCADRTNFEDNYAGNEMVRYDNEDIFSALGFLKENIFNTALESISSFNDNVQVSLMHWIGNCARPHLDGGESQIAMLVESQPEAELESDKQSDSQSTYIWTQEEALRRFRAKLEADYCLSST